MQAPAAAAQQPSSGASGLSSLSGLSVLQNTRPVDRLRFQAILVFKNFDEGSRGEQHFACELCDKDICALDYLVSWWGMAAEFAAYMLAKPQFNV